MNKYNSAIAGLKSNNCEKIFRRDCPYYLFMGVKNQEV